MKKTPAAEAGQQLSLLDLMKDFDFSINGSTATKSTLKKDARKPDVLIGYRCAGDHRKQTVGDFHFNNFMKRLNTEWEPSFVLHFGWVVIGVNKKGRAKKAVFAFESDKIPDRAFIKNNSAQSKPMAEKLITAIGLEIPDEKDSCIQIAGNLMSVNEPGPDHVYLFTPLWACYSEGTISVRHEFDENGKLIRPRKRINYSPKIK